MYCYKCLIAFEEFIRITPATHYITLVTYWMGEESYCTSLFCEEHYHYMLPIWMDRYKGTMGKILSNGGIDKSKEIRTSM